MFTTDQHLTVMLSHALVHTFSPAYTMAQVRQIYTANKPMIDLTLNDTNLYQLAVAQFGNDVANIIIVDKSEVF